MVSIYLRVNEGLTEANLLILQHAAILIKSLKGPFIIGGDWNLEPHVLEAANWTSMVGGRIHAPSQPTCNANVYDYFVVSVGLKHSVVGVAVIDDAGFYPHMPVRLFLKGRPRAEQARLLVAPRKLPACIPQGCVRECGELVAEDITLHRLAGIAFDRAEQEIVGLCGFDGRDAELSCGRAKGPKFVSKPAVGPPGSECPKSTAISVAWMCIATLLRHLVAGGITGQRLGIFGVKPERRGGVFARRTGVRLTRG